MFSLCLVCETVDDIEQKMILVSKFFGYNWVQATDHTCDSANIYDIIRISLVYLILTVHASCSSVIDLNKYDVLL